jgi:hypothetical protein
MKRLILAIVALTAVSALAACCGGGKEVEVRLVYEFDWRSTPDGKSLIRFGATNITDLDWDGDLEWDGIANLRQTNKHGDLIETLNILEAPAIAADDREWFGEWILDIPAGPYYIDLGADGYGRIETHWSLQDRGGGTVKGFLQMRDDQPVEGY